MPRLVHLARASNARGIERAGIRAPLFAMPVLPDFSVTYQWVRELRRWHGERMVAVHFIVSRDEEVVVGRYDSKHARVPIGVAIARVMKAPAGNEIIVERAITKKEIVGIREIPQLVGWTEIPEASKKFDCLCVACVPPGTRELIRRVRGQVARFLRDAESAKTEDEKVAALRRLDVPLERAAGRLSPDKLLAFARADSAGVRRVAAALLGSFEWADVEAPLVTLLADTHADVRKTAVESMIRSGGSVRTHAHIRETEEALAILVEHLGFESDAELAMRLLSEISSTGSLRAAIVEAQERLAAYG